ncbi:hypothetical protein [Streptomyces vastus]|uniref:Lipoprotein n=1 Tax=Streptomyces vastus TaxID=285451 RepID=A0ABN3QLQ9_9ACTN
MKRLWGVGVAVATGAAALLLAGCSAPTDYSEVVTFTDEHGRACTAAVVVDQSYARTPGLVVDERAPGPAQCAPRRGADPSVPSAPIEVVRVLLAACETDGAA